jgi:hypothetical protein
MLKHLKPCNLAGFEVTNSLFVAELHTAELLSGSAGQTEASNQEPEILLSSLLIHNKVRKFK